MKKLDDKDLEKIISDEASEEVVHKFDELFRDSTEKTGNEFTDSVIRKYTSEFYSRKYPIRLTTVALSLIVVISLVIILLFDSFSIPSMSDPMLEQWMSPVSESTSLIKQLIMIVDSILMLILIDKFALRPFFNR